MKVIAFFFIPVLELQMFKDTFHAIGDNDPSNNELRESSFRSAKVIHPQSLWKRNQEGVH